MNKGIIFGAVLTAVGALWALPSITLNRVQQRYPWNGKVDIDFSIADLDAGDEGNYYVQFYVKPSSEAPQLLLREFLDASKLYTPENGNTRVTWNSAWEDSEYRFLSKTAQVQAELVRCEGGDKRSAPYGARYVIVDLSAGCGDDTHYPVSTTNFYTQAEANTYFNTDEFKTSKLALRRVRSGSFKMGTENDNQRDVSSSEFWPETQHLVTLTHNFLIGVFPLTCRQWQYIRPLTMEGYGAKLGKYEKCPMSWRNECVYDYVRGTNVSAMASVNPTSLLGFLSSHTGDHTTYQFDLPTESQWEYACRAGTEGALYTDDIDYKDLNALKGICSVSNSPESINVGSYAPNPWGLYDMIGLVAESCRDRFYLSTAHSWGSSHLVDPVNDETGEPKKLTFVARGGKPYASGECWMFRCAARRRWTICGTGDTAFNTGHIVSLGFRVACTLE